LTAPEAPSGPLERVPEAAHMTSGWRWVGWLLAVVSLALAVGVALTSVRLADRTSAADTRSEVLGAARQLAVDLTTFQPSQIHRQLAAIEQLSTGPFRAEFNRDRNRILSYVGGRRTSRGVVIAAAVSGITGNSADVLVALDDVVSGSQVPAGTAPLRFRMLVHLLHTGRGWLVDNVTEVS
jgi:Mce-associated membrane protein